MPASILWPKRLPTSLKNISNGSVSNIFDDHIALSLLTIEPPLEMDLNAAKMEFFSKENSGKWVVLEKWHEYQLEGIRQQLGQSGGSSSKGAVQR